MHRRLLCAAALSLGTAADAAANKLPAPHPHRDVHSAAIQHRFLPALQIPAGAPLNPGSDLVNVTRDLGANNPSAQFDGANWHFHFARGDAGWISAFEVANANHIHRIYFPRGTYWFGQTTATPQVYKSTKLDLSLYPNLYNGDAMDIFGDGDYQTHFTVWAPIVDGSMLEISTTKTFASMSWKIHGTHCGILSVNSDSRKNVEVAPFSYDFNRRK